MLVHLLFWQHPSSMVKCSFEGTLLNGRNANWSKLWVLTGSKCSDSMLLTMKLYIDPNSIPKEVTSSKLCRLLDMSYPTLRSWMLTGRISTGRKVFHNRVFTKAEVIKALRLDRQPTTAGKRWCSVILSKRKWHTNWRGKRLKREP